MKLTLQRLVYTDASTAGQLFVNDEMECWTLELPHKDGKPGSAIPAGTYRVVLGPSPKFLQSNDPWVKKYAGKIPHIQNIPGRSNILIHWGNYPKDTEGCILVGRVHQPNFVGESRTAFAELHEKLIGTERNFEEVELTVIDKPTQ